MTEDTAVRTVTTRTVGEGDDAITYDVRGDLADATPDRPALFLFAWQFFKLVVKAFRRADESDGRQTTVLQENLTGTNRGEIGETFTVIVRYRPRRLTI